MNPELKIHRRSGRWDFTTAEVEAFKDAMGPRMNQRDALLSEIDSLKATIKAKQAHIDSLLDSNATDARKIRDGHENRDQDCYRLANWPKRVYQYFAIDTKKWVADEMMRPQEGQLSGHHDGMFGDIIELETDQVQFYRRTLYWEGRTWSFGPRIPDVPLAENPEQTEEGSATLYSNPNQDATTVLQITSGDEIMDVDFEHFDPNEPNPVLFRNNLDIQDIIDAHQDPNDDVLTAFAATWELTQSEIDAVMQFHWERTAKGTDPNDQPAIDPNILIDFQTLKRDENDHVVLVRNGLKSIDVYNMSQKDDKIWKKYVKAHSLTEEEIENVGRFHDLPF